VRVAGKKIETVSDGINEPVGNLDAAAFFGDGNNRLVRSFDFFPEDAPERVF
jgi:hypothetical protein